MISDNPPRKHHFAPEFYLTKWVNGDGKLEQFHASYNGIVKVRTLPPSATGFKYDLYALAGLEGAAAQTVESTFMQTLDSRAATVLSEMEQGLEPTSSEARSDWTRFLQSLQLRTPSDRVRP